jgi:hypothetical protein
MYAGPVPSPALSCLEPRLISPVASRQYPLGPRRGQLEERRRCNRAAGHEPGGCRGLDASRRRGNGVCVGRRTSHGASRGRALSPARMRYDGHGRFTVELNGPLAGLELEFDVAHAPSVQVYANGIFGLYSSARGGGERDYEVRKLVGRRKRQAEAPAPLGGGAATRKQCIACSRAAPIRAPTWDLSITCRRDSWTASHRRRSGRGVCG